MSSISYAVATVLVTMLAAPTITLSQSRSTLPSPQTQNAIQSLSIEPRAVTRSRGGAASQPEFRNFKVDPEKLPPTTRGAVQLDEQGQANAPLLIPNTIIIQFTPDASKENIDDFL